MELFPQFVWPTKINAGSSEKRAVTSFLSFTVYSNSARGVLKSKWMSPIASVSSRSRWSCFRWSWWRACLGQLRGKVRIARVCRHLANDFIEILDRIVVYLLKCSFASSKIFEYVLERHGWNRKRKGSESTEAIYWMRNVTVWSSITFLGKTGSLHQLLLKGLEWWYGLAGKEQRLNIQWPHCIFVTKFLNEATTAATRRRKMSYVC